jgi:hypothetical protein
MPTMEGKFPKAPALREARPDDYEQITALQLRNGLLAKSKKNWTGLWFENPAYTSRCPMGWVLQTQSGEIVGSLSNIPLAYCFRGRDIRAATACSWAVDAAYRAYSTSLFQHFVTQRDAGLLVCTTVSPAVEPVLSAFRFSRVPLGNWGRSAFWVTNYEGFARSVLNRNAARFASALTYPATAALSCLDVVANSRLQPRNSADIELCSEFDSRFEIFWQELAALSPCLLMAVRSRHTMAWHFREALAAQRVWIVAARKGSRLLGYAVFDRQDNATVGLARLRLVDFQALSGAQGILRSILSWTLQRCRSERIHTLEVTGGFLDPRSSVRVNAPYRRTLPSWTYYYKATDNRLAEELRDPSVWRPTSFDGDASL